MDTKTRETAAAKVGANGNGQEEDDRFRAVAENIDLRFRVDKEELPASQIAFYEVSRDQIPRSLWREGTRPKEFVVRPMTMWRPQTGHDLKGTLRFNPRGKILVAEPAAEDWWTLRTSGELVSSITCYGYELEPIPDSRLLRHKSSGAIVIVPTGTQRPTKGTKDKLFTLNTTRGPFYVLHGLLKGGTSTETGIVSREVKRDPLQPDPVAWADIRSNGRVRELRMMPPHELLGVIRGMTMPSAIEAAATRLRRALFRQWAPDTLRNRTDISKQQAVDLEEALAVNFASLDTAVADLTDQYNAMQERAEQAAAELFDTLFAEEARVVGEPVTTTLVCPKCGTNNRVRDQGEGKIPVCGKCKTPLLEEATVEAVLVPAQPAGDPESAAAARPTKGRAKGGKKPSNGDSFDLRRLQEIQPEYVKALAATRIGSPNQRSTLALNLAQALRCFPAQVSQLHTQDVAQLKMYEAGIKEDRTQQLWDYCLDPTNTKEAEKK